MTDISSQTLHVVAKELAATLGDARTALEDYAERSDHRESLEKCAEQLHAAHGVLRMVEVYGAALLAEEMEHVAHYLLELNDDEKRRIEGLDALMRAMVQLPTYLERVLSGGRDLALILLPLLNDLRSVRGSPLLSEGTLLLLNLKSDQSPRGRSDADGQAAVALWARRLRPRFQVGLLGLIRGERTEQSLEIMAKVAEKLEQVATTQPVFQFWWVTGAVLEALQANGLEASATLKRLLGQTDRQIKVLYDLGEERYCDNPPVELLNNLLYYVARSSAGGGRIGAVRASFKLTELLPVDDAIEQERASLSAPSVKLMRTVGAAIKEDLAKVKDVLDIFVRRGGGRVEDLAPQLELLKKISDTLGVLGLGELRQRVRREAADLSTILASGAPPAEDALLKVAGVLLSVEDSLDDQLVRLILPSTAAPSGAESEDLDFRLVSEAVLRECSVNLARIKEAISIAVQKTGDGSPQGLDNVPQLLRGITAGLLMLGKTRAAELMDALAVHVRALVEPGAIPPDPLRLERIADAIVSIEYYMETIQSGRNDPWYMLDNAETCVKALAEDYATRLPSAPTGPPAGAEAATTVRIESRDTVVLTTAPAVSAPPPPSGPDSAPDPQLVELFIEEAKDEMAAIGRRFPLWEQNPMDGDSLNAMRRSFHTLKGSGRMVGARVIGDFAWSIENLLNRLIDKTLTRTPEIISVVRTAIDALPQVIEQLETGRPARVAVDQLIARAHATVVVREPAGGSADVRAAAGSEESPEPAEPADAHEAAVVAAPPAPATMDPMLHDIFSKEAETHLAAIRRYLQTERGRLAPHDLPETIYRAVHTLCGSSKMAEARHGIRVTEPLNQYLRKAYDSGLGLPEAALGLLEDAVAAIENVVAHIDESTVFFAEQPMLLERIRALDAALDAELARAEEDAEISQVLPSGIAATTAATTAATEVAAPAAMPPPRSEAATPPEGFDREIADIYSEEATELLESAQASLAAWSADRNDKAPVAELQRQLHTLKGGARMAGIAPMGDLSHELETLVIQIANGAIPATESTHAVLQVSLDELALMRDLVSAGTWPPPAEALIGRIRALGAGLPEPAPATAAKPVPAAPAAPIGIVESAPEARPPSPEAVSGAAVPAAGGETPAAIEPVMPAGPVAPDLAASSLELTVAAMLPGRDTAPVERAEMARVDADLLDKMLNNAGEVSIFRSRLDQQVGSIDFNLAELARTVTRLKEQLRGLEIETETQVLHRHPDADPRRGEFDPLELDRYSALQQYSRALAETSSDVGSIQGLLESLVREAQNLLAQQARVITELQNSLMRTRMVPFQRHVQRLTRLVRQAANDTGKRAELTVDGAAAELDRQMLERMVPPLEHMLRNAVVHGIESPERRAALGKPAVGRITVSLERDGAEVVIVVADDGAGINVGLIRDKAIALGLVDPQSRLTDEEAMQLILEPGFSTAGRVTQAAGRGVGMDVVATEVKKLGGGLFIESTLDKGSRFTIRLPFTLAISQALIVRVGEETYALPLATVEGVVRLPRSIVARHLGRDGPPFDYGGQKYRFQHLGNFVGLGASPLPEADVSMAVVLIRAGEHSTALVTDELVGSREIVVKSLGPQISGIRGIAGATILGDGRIVVILDMGALVRSEWRSRPADTVTEQRERRTVALVVDDSITVRRVTQRLLERNGMRVVTAKDGVEAVSILQDLKPDVILLDIEMPRMDGYEVAAHVRNEPRLRDIPIVMITSRVSEKHRARAIELGVNDYLGKPYQESQLLDAIEPLVNRRSAVGQ